MQDDAHWEEVDRLWRSFRRDLSSTLVEFTREGHGTKAADRLGRTWSKICDLDVEVAATIQHAVSQIDLIVSDDRVAEFQERQRNEYIGMMRMAREKNPDAKTETVGDLMKLADETIQREIDEDTGGTA